MDQHEVVRLWGRKGEAPMERKADEGDEGKSNWMWGSKQSDTLTLMSHLSKSPLRVSKSKFA